MSVCEWLEQVKKLDELIVGKQAEIDRLNELATNMTSKPLDGMPFNNTGLVSDPVGNGATNLAMLAAEKQRLLEKYVAHKEMVISTLERLPAKEYGVLHRHYIRYMTLEDIAEDMGYCRQQIWRIKKKALEMLEDVIECYMTM